MPAIDRIARTARPRVARFIARRLPPAVADGLRRPVPDDVARSWRGRARLAVLGFLRDGGIPAAVDVFRLVDEPRLSFVTADSLVLAQLYWFGEQGWEPELVPWWRYLCRHAHVILELGANVGYFTVQGGRAATSARYVAVEPHPFSRALCRSNLDLNGITTVRLIGAAAVPDPAMSSVQLQVPSDQLLAPTVAFVPADSELPPDMVGDTVATIDVPAVDVRSLLPGVDLLKLDVEGQEHVLLAAGRRHLRACRPTIVVEVLRGTHRLRGLLADLCVRDGYRCYAVTRYRLVRLHPDRLATVDLDREYGSHDVIACAARLPSTLTGLDASLMTTDRPAPSAQWSSAYHRRRRSGA